MADEKKANIVIKKIQGGHAGAHGGAWKVAFADFMTALMTFFLVMWLLGSDEEIKASIQQYFNNPASAWRPSHESEKTVPLGEKTGAGDDLLTGMQGQFPADMVERPARAFKTETDLEKGDNADEQLAGKPPEARVEVEILKFSIPEIVLFNTGTDSFKPKANLYLGKVNQVLKNFKGYLTIQGNTEPEPNTNADPYEFTVSRIAAIEKLVLDEGWAEETKTRSVVRDGYELDLTGRFPAGNRLRKIEFVLTKDPPR